MLQIKNSKTHKVVYELGKFESQDDAGISENPATVAQKKTIRALCEKHKIEVEMLYASNGITEETVTDKQAAEIMQGFKKKYGDN